MRRVWCSNSRSEAVSELPVWPPVAAPHSTLQVGTSFAPTVQFDGPLSVGVGSLATGTGRTALPATGLSSP
ncbi:hypothetical protein Asera_02270 [Actinocatenispora sera]|uniref:Uncharacterized protein n=1 Tax=Actinocatenispora sera TaxID=390989 RepID=A0A810KUT0_9ACTN|nr:hypothetical protein Asera_02270 [Actinocatenispora sera]